jgi:hypothetical protein
MIDSSNELIPIGFKLNERQISRLAYVGIAYVVEKDRFWYRR